MIEKFKNKELALKSLAFLIIPAVYFLYSLSNTLIYRIGYFSQNVVSYRELIGNSALIINLIETCLSAITGFSIVILLCITCFFSSAQKLKKVSLGVFAFSIIISKSISIFVNIVIEIGAIEYLEKYPNPVLHAVFATVMMSFAFVVPFLKAILAIRAIKGPFKTNKFVMVVAILAVVGCFTGIFSDFLNAVQWASQGYVNFFLKNILVDVVKAVVSGYMNFCFVYFCLGGNEIKLKNVKGDC